MEQDQSIIIESQNIYLVSETIQECRLDLEIQRAAPRGESNFQGAAARFFPTRFGFEIFAG